MGILLNQKIPSRGEMRYFCKNYWFASILIVLSITFFSVNIQNRLVIGSILFFLIGIKTLLFSLRNKELFSIFSSNLIIFLGLIFLLTRFLLPSQRDLFILILFVFVFLNFVYYTIIERNLDFMRRLIILPGILVFGAVFILMFKSLILEINISGIPNLIFYISTILFSFSILIIFYLIIKFVIEGFYTLILKKNYCNEYLYLSFSVGFFILAGGYFYLLGISNNYLRDFLIILSWAFFLSLTGISALKNILKKEKD